MKQRKAGRPRGKQISLRQEQLAALPEAAPMCVFAGVLGISASTMRLWIIIHGCPALSRADRQGYTLLREPVIEWLKKTGRVEGVPQCVNANDVEPTSAATAKPSIA